MIIYGILLVTWVLINNYHDPYKGSTLALCFKLAIPLALVMGLRHVCVGSDTEQYVLRYNNSDALMFDDNYQWEKGYNYINYLFNDILNLDWQWFLMFTSIIYCIALSLFIASFSRDPYLGFFLHLTIGMFVMSVSGIRQSIAVSICTLALIVFLKSNLVRYKKYACSVLLIMLAYTFHNSSLIYLPVLLFLTGRRISKRTATFCILFGISSLVLKTFFVPIIQIVMISKYAEMSLNTNYVSNILVYAVPIAIGVFCLMYVNTEMDGKYSNEISTMFIFLSLTIFFISMKSLNNQIGRLAYYFIYSYSVLIPQAFTTMNRETRKTLYPGLIIVCILYFVIGNSGNIMQIDDYHFFWEDVVWTNRGDL